MIIEREMERLSQLGTARVDYDRLIETAVEHSENWHDTIVERSNHGLRMDKDANMLFRSNGWPVTTDVTQNAFEQYCNIIGVPSSYAMKCYENGLGDLAVTNFDRWQEMMPEQVKVRTYGADHIVHAVVSPRFTEVANARIFELLNDAVDFSRYQCNQAFLSPEKMHLRFVDFTPLPGVSDRMFAGFTVSNNEIGRGALSVKFFLYRFACKNGLVRTQRGGTLFSQKHLGLTVEDEKAFAASFENIEMLRQSSVDQILAAQKKILSYKEMESMIERVRKECHLGKDPKIGEVSAQEWIGNEFGNNLWGVINFVTQKAQEYNLDDRLAMEQYAGTLLMAA